MIPSTTPPGETILSLTALRVTDLSRSIEFYTAGCGFEREREFSTDTFDAVIVRAGAAGVEMIRPHDRPSEVEHGSGLEKLVLNTPDAVALIEQMVAHGGSELMAPTVLEKYGMVIGKVGDPDGYVIEVVGALPESGGRA